MKVVILRQWNKEWEGIFGVLLHDGFMCYTGELPWYNNMQSYSCIPEGTYEVEPWHSKKYSQAYHIKDVPNRTAILIHSGNFCGLTTRGYKTNVQGCILLGKAIGTIGGQAAVLNSKVACNAFHQVIGENTFTLEIRNQW